MGYKKTIVRFDEKKAEKDFLQRIIILQTKNFEEYAQEELDLMIKNHTFTNRTYNTQDSYCWCVYFNGKLISYGLNSEAQTALKKAKFHGREIDGRAEAKDFISKYEPKNKKGWEVVWAATTPYSTYLESGNGVRRFLVVSSQYDSIKKTFAGKGKVEFIIRY